MPGKEAVRVSARSPVIGPRVANRAEGIGHPPFLTPRIHEIGSPDHHLTGHAGEEKRALLDLLKRTIENDRYPLSARIRMLEAILAKLDPASVTPANPYPAPKQYKPPRAVRTRRCRAGG